MEHFNTTYNRLNFNFQTPKTFFFGVYMCICVCQCSSEPTNDLQCHQPNPHQKVGHYFPQPTPPSINNKFDMISPQVKD